MFCLFQCFLNRQFNSIHLILWIALVSSGTVSRNWLLLVCNALFPSLIHFLPNFLPALIQRSTAFSVVRSLKLGLQWQLFFLTHVHWSILPVQWKGWSGAIESKILLFYFLVTFWPMQRTAEWDRFAVIEAPLLHFCFSVASVKRQCHSKASCERAFANAVAFSWMQSLHRQKTQWEEPHLTGNFSVNSLFIFFNWWTFFGYKCFLVRKS